MEEEKVDTERKERLEWTRRVTIGGLMRSQSERQGKARKQGEGVKKRGLGRRCSTEVNEH